MDSTDSIDGRTEQDCQDFTPKYEDGHPWLFDKMDELADKLSDNTKDGDENVQDKKAKLKSR